jgi:hypothetical protein
VALPEEVGVGSVVQIDDDGVCGGPEVAADLGWAKRLGLGAADPEGVREGTDERGGLLSGLLWRAAQDNAAAVSIGRWAHLDPLACRSRQTR